jgi:hypothetical protein
MKRHADKQYDGFVQAVKKKRGDRSPLSFIRERKQLPCIFPLPGQAGHDKPV